MNLSFLYVMLFLLSISSHPPADRVIERLDLNRFFATEQLTGSFSLYDSARHTYTTYRRECYRRGFLPAPTFKILNTLVGLETGVTPDSSPATLSRKTARCAPWRPGIAIRPLRRPFGYRADPIIRNWPGALRWPDASLPHAGELREPERRGAYARYVLAGRSCISQEQQIDFLRRVWSGNVPFSVRSRAILKSIMRLYSQPTYRLYGRAGWTGSQTQSGTANLLNIGWFVGYVETKHNVYFFATNVESRPPAPATFGPSRRRITEAMLRELGVL